MPADLPRSQGPADPAPAPQPLIFGAVVAAVVLPAMLAFNLPPSATMLNQCLAVALWGGVVLLLAPAGRIVGRGVGVRAAWPLHAVFGLLALAMAGSSLFGALPLSLACGSLGVAVSGWVAFGAGVDAARRADAPATWTAMATGLLVAGGLSTLVALVQVFAPEWTDGRWIAHTGLPGRAVGNLRQPNHLSSLLLWAVVGAVTLRELKRMGTATLAALVAALVFAVELSASRTGAVGLLLLLAWGLADRRLSRASRVVLAATPLLYLASYAAMTAYGHWLQQDVGAGARLAQAAVGADSPNSRLNIWHNALVMIGRHPWTGVGWGEFNFAWTLTPFPGRPTAFFDHTHDLPLQLMVELGLPLAGALLLLMALGLVHAWRGSLTAEGSAGVTSRSALVVVLMIGLHSIVEYPLWYSYFLLPAAFAWGFALGTSPSADPVAAAAPGRLPRWGAVAGLVMAMGGAGALLEYGRIVSIYAPSEGDLSPLEARIARGQLGILFAHQADYAAATTAGMPEAMRSLGLQRAPHNLLDTRLMVAWARQLAASGRLDEARALADRLREFHHAESDTFFAPCGPGAASGPAAGADAAASAPAAGPAASDAFQCRPIGTGAPDWRRYAQPATAGQPAQPASATQ